MTGPNEPNNGTGQPPPVRNAQTLGYLCDLIHELKHLADRSGQRTLSAILAAVAYAGLANVVVFIGMMMALFFLFGLVAPNFNALAMEPQGDNAGMASSVVGFASTAAGALAGGIIGHLFNGTVLPLALGFLALSLLAFAVVVSIEGPRGVFHPGR